MSRDMKPNYPIALSVTSQPLHGQSKIEQCWISVFTLCQCGIYFWRVACFEPGAIRKHIQLFQHQNKRRRPVNVQQATAACHQALRWQLFVDQSKCRARSRSRRLSDDRRGSLTYRRPERITAGGANYFLPATICAMASVHRRRKSLRTRTDVGPVTTFACLEAEAALPSNDWCRCHPNSKRGLPMAPLFREPEWSHKSQCDRNDDRLQAL